MRLGLLDGHKAELVSFFGTQGASTQLGEKEEHLAVQIANVSKQGRTSWGAQLFLDLNRDDFRKLCRRPGVISARLIRVRNSTAANQARHLSGIHRHKVAAWLEEAPAAGLEFLPSSSRIFLAAFFMQSEEDRSQGGGRADLRIHRPLSEHLGIKHALNITKGVLKLASSEHHHEQHLHANGRALLLHCHRALCARERSQAHAADKATVAYAPSRTCRRAPSSFHPIESGRPR